MLIAKIKIDQNRRMAEVNLCMDQHKFKLNLNIPILRTEGYSKKIIFDTYNVKQIPGEVKPQTKDSSSYEIKKEDENNYCLWQIEQGDNFVIVEFCAIYDQINKTQVR